MSKRGRLGIFTLLVVAVVAILFYVSSKPCKAATGVSLYSGYYSAAHMVGVVGEYTDDYDWEFGGYITNNDSTSQSGVTAFLAQGNLKAQINTTLNLLYGLSFEIFTNGQINGVGFTGVGYGPYIGLERRLDESIRLRALYHPVYITTIDKSGVKTTTTDFGLNGAFGLTYIF